MVTCRLSSVLWILLIQVPFEGIVDDVLPDACQVLLRPYYVFVVPPLPDALARSVSMRGALPGYCCFERADNI